jgi:CubicO group peptidase (beta-lactamase class C family)
MIMQLVDEGLLSLDTTVSAVLPGARLGTADVGDQVTVRHLLTHTSGIDGDVFTDTGRGDDCVERYVDLLAEVPSVFTPGATYSYCNSGYVLLGRIIEVIDGQSWDESLRERLIGPLAATQTVTLPAGGDPAPRGRRPSPLRHPGARLGPAAQHRAGRADHRHGR